MNPKQKGGRHYGMAKRQSLTDTSPIEIWKTARAGTIPRDVRAIVECLKMLDLMTKGGGAMPDPITRKLARCMLNVYRDGAAEKLRALADIVARGTYSADPLYEALVSLGMRAAEPGESVRDSLARIPKGQIAANLKAAGVRDTDDTTIRKALNQLGIQGKPGVKTARK